MKKRKRIRFDERKESYNSFRLFFDYEKTWMVKHKRSDFIVPQLDVLEVIDDGDNISILFNTEKEFSNGIETIMYNKLNKYLNSCINHHEKVINKIKKSKKIDKKLNKFIRQNKINKINNET